MEAHWQPGGKYDRVLPPKSTTTKSTRDPSRQPSTFPQRLLIPPRRITCKARLEYFFRHFLRRNRDDPYAGWFMLHLQTPTKYYSHRYAHSFNFVTFADSNRNIIDVVRFLALKPLERFTTLPFTFFRNSRSTSSAPTSHVRLIRGDGTQAEQA